MIRYRNYSRVGKLFFFHPKSAWGAYEAISHISVYGELRNSRQTSLEVQRQRGIYYSITSRSDDRDV